MKTIITNAIKGKHLIQFEYDGDIRIVEPHCFGETKKGNAVFRGFQTDGNSSTGNLGWKMFDLSKVSSLESSKNVFTSPRPGYS
ncbi:MAG: hypothetical protein JWQ25_126 [Daejeonella sp.]|nr:hypothetical protein [Daejeonella sp.]